MSQAAESIAPIHRSKLRDRYVRAQLSGDRREALRVVVEEGIGELGLSPKAAQHVIQDAQREIGRLWQEDRITIAQEHMATAISQVVLSHLYQLAEAQPSNGKKVLVACVEGELHDFPARLVADALDLAGFDVRYLGANVPLEGLLAMVRDERPDLVALSVTMTFNVASLRLAVERVRELTQGRTPIAVGGGACAWKGTAEELGVDVTGADAEELVAGAERALGVAR